MFNTEYTPHYTKLSTERSFFPENSDYVSTGNSSFSNEDLKGAHTLIFFGYTNCPDYCPDTLMKIRQVFKKLENNGIERDIRMLFISVDTSDDLLKIKKYVEYFDSSFQGLATKDSELKELAKRVGVYYKEISMDGSVKFFDHTSAIFITNKNANLIGLYTPPVNINNIFEDIVNSFY
tara:strand:+ start:16820 stop:17353 length:534 start_codon:yes stop_codon:yes gene_type:complete